MVSNEEIKRMLEAKRKGINIKDEKDISENDKICTQCKTKNPEKAIFCVNCGRKLEKNLVIKCPSCGSENTVVAKFCVGCGEKLNQKTIDTKSSTIKPKIQSTENLIGDDVEFPESKNESESINKIQEIESKPNEKPIISSNVSENDQLLKKDTKKLCPACNGKNLENAKFCVVCGKNFEIKNTTSDLAKEEDLKQASTPEIKVPKGILNIDKKIDKKYNDPEESNQKSESVSNKATYIDPVDKIKKSKELLDMGAITSEEFENIKKKYLEKI